MNTSTLVLLISATSLAIGLFNFCQTSPKLAAADIDAFNQWKNRMGKNYATPSEVSYRMNVFAKNLAMIKSHNSMNGNGFKMALNKFADMTSAEFKTKYTMGASYRPRRNRQPANLDHVEVTATELDWVSKGAVTPVKDQGQCGSCWAFGTSGATEGLHFVKKGTLLSFSEQELMDCTWKEGNMGCNGGLPVYAYPYIKSSGIMLESDYPYKGKSSHKCHTDPAKVQYKITGYKEIKMNDNDALIKALNIQPISIGVDAEKLQFYSTGIISKGCGQQLDHSVLLVGYGQTSSGELYWKVKNSWASDWGESGYFRVLRKTGVAKSPCGVPQDCDYPVDTA